MRTSRTTSGLTLFQQAVHDNSNLEMDWLWVASQVERESERRYCFQQALRINPCSQLAQRGLQQLQQVISVQRECLA